MAKYQIERACGHYETVNICGPHKDRDRKAEYESEKLCRECYQAKLQAERDVAAAQAADAADAQGLPELTGSEKQIKWALQIRAEKLADAAAIRDRFAAAPSETQRQAAENALASIETETSASWWIDNRSEPLINLVAAKGRELMS